MTTAPAPAAPTTLLDELRAAAEHADLLAETNGSPHWREWAARFGARATHVESYQKEHPGHEGETCPYCVATRWVSGVLPLPESRRG